MRITVKQLGDHSERWLAGLRPGTRVAIEGPYGAFTHHARHTDRVLLVAAGVGSTPVRAMLDDLPRHVDVVAILRGSSDADLVLRDEIAQLVDERGGRLHEVVGSRSQAPLDAPALAPARARHRASATSTSAAPAGSCASLIAEAARLGVPPSASTTRTSPSERRTTMKRSPSSSPPRPPASA